MIHVFGKSITSNRVGNTEPCLTLRLRKAFYDLFGFGRTTLPSIQASEFEAENKMEHHGANGCKWRARMHR